MILDYNYWYFDQAIPHNVCENIIKVGKDKKLDVALAGDNTDPAKQDLKLRNSNVSWIDEDWLYGLIFPFVHEANKNDWHYDFNSDGDTIRKLSVVIALSDPSEYEGGNFLLSNANVVKPSKDLTVSELKPKGSFVIFPSFLWHKVMPVTKGVRYSAVTWLRGTNFV